MTTKHFIDLERLCRRDFLQLRCLAGRNFCEFEMQDYARNLLGIPLFMLKQFVMQVYKYLIMLLGCCRNILRHAMDALYAPGAPVGRIRQGAGNAQVKYEPRLKAAVSHSP